MDGLGLLSQCPLEADLDLVRPLAHRRALFLAQRPQAAEDLHDRRTASQVGYPPLGKALFILNRFQFGQGGLLDLVQFFKHATSL